VSRFLRLHWEDSGICSYTLRNIGDIRFRKSWCGEASKSFHIVFSRILLDLKTLNPICESFREVPPANIAPFIDAFIYYMRELISNVINWFTFWRTWLTSTVVEDVQVSRHRDVQRANIDEFIHYMRELISKVINWFIFWHTSGWLPPRWETSKSGTATVREPHKCSARSHHDLTIEPSWSPPPRFEKVVWLRDWCQVPNIAYVESARLEVVKRNATPTL